MEKFERDILIEILDLGMPVVPIEGFAHELALVRMNLRVARSAIVSNLPNNAGKKRKCSINLSRSVGRLTA